MPNVNHSYKKLITDIGNALQRARERAINAVNYELVVANWEIGKYIIEFEQKGKDKAEYGSSLLTNLSRDLKLAYGKGFGKSNIYLCRQFYLKYPIFQTLSGKLSWSHYTELLNVSNKIFVSRYQLYLPDQKQLENKVKQILENDE